ncbi:MAG TPA: hypothetical protein DIS98_00220 [Colwellia sp.]|nr:hypothetical protein [Colwellia sp.]|tara:strand:+ start:567 stop:1214 length:648 start_codon:yes stop_codon:yes gene_type:complete
MATSINPKDSTDDNTVTLISNSTSNSDHTSNQTSKHRNRRSLLLLLLVFILPILVAKLALENQWLDLGVTNQGKLLDQPLTLSQLGINESEYDKQWLIIYRLPNVCPEICLHSIEAVHNSYVALGKDMPRVSPVLLNKNIFSVQQSKQLAKSQWQILTLTSQMNNLLLEPQVLIADPLGNIILRHQLPEKIEQQAAFGKAIIADMKKLLKYSKVG